MTSLLTRIKNLWNQQPAPADKISPTRTYSPREAAELLHMSERAIQRACKAARVKASLTKTWRISGKSLIDYEYQRSSD